MVRNTLQIFRITLLLVIIFTAHAIQAQKHSMRRGPSMSRAQKIALAMSAAPAEISRHATIMDMTDMAKPKQLRAGTNGWMCGIMIIGKSQEVMCLDKEWQKWAGAWMNKTQPEIDGTGIAYMLRGDKGASNTDPYATGPTSDNQWVV